MSLFSKLFGGGSKAGSSGPEPQDFEGFLIYPAPVKQPGGYRIGARIEKEIDGELRQYDLIRADVISDPEEAERMSVLKAQLLIKEQGDRLFD